MKLTQNQIELLREARIELPPDVIELEFLEADEEERLGDLLLNSLAEGQEMTPKAREIRELLNSLA